MLTLAAVLAACAVPAVGTYAVLVWWLDRDASDYEHDPEEKVWRTRRPGGGGK